MQFGERYDILRRIGRGTTASVFLARDKHLDKKWAVKVFPDSIYREKDAAWEINNEIEILKLIRHADMPTAVDLYRENAGIYLVMDYIEGISLSSFVQQYGSISEELALIWMLEVCSLLNTLHKMEPQIIFCDLKPENIILQRNGRLALVDFGSARVLHLHTEDKHFFSGTEGFTAPELKCSENVKVLTENVDIYSVGATFFYLTTGMHPVHVQRIDTFSKPFAQVLQGCLAKKEDRFANCDILSEKIRKIKRKNGVGTEN